MEAAEFGGPEVGGQDLLGEELAVRDVEGTAGRAPRDERIAIAGCGGWRCGEEERWFWLCGTASAGDDGVLLLLLSCRFHLEHLVEAAGELLGNPSLPCFREGNGGGEGGGGHRPGLHGGAVSGCDVAGIIVIFDTESCRRATQKTGMRSKKRSDENDVISGQRASNDGQARAA